MERTREYSIAPFPHHGLVCGTPRGRIVVIWCVCLSRSGTIPLLESSKIARLGLPDDRNAVAFATSFQTHRMAGERNYRGLCARGQQPFFSRDSGRRWSPVPFRRPEGRRVRPLSGSFAPGRREESVAQNTFGRRTSVTDRDSAIHGAGRK